MVIVFSHHRRTEFSQPLKLSRHRFTSQVEMDAVLHDLPLWYQLEEKSRLHARRLDKDARVVLGIKDPDTAQAGELGLIVRSNFMTVEGGGPETSDRRGMTAIEYDIVKSGHGHHHAAASPLSRLAGSAFLAGGTFRAVD
jgi:hypothetical protein